MANPSRAARGLSAARSTAVPTVLLPVKMPPDLRRRFKVAAASRDMTYAQLIEHWLDEEARRVARAASRQAHPLHQPGAVAAS